MTTAFDGIADLRTGGSIAKLLPGYTERAAQITMAEIVARAIDGKTHAVVEAGTGTGKSLGYLLPIVRSGKVAIISTANKALQEQLFYKDIPFVQKHVIPFKAALVKGMNNYLCLDHLEQYRSELVPQEDTGVFDEIGSKKEDWDGDFEAPGAPELASPVRIALSADSDRCAWGKCPFYKDCYIRQMRERAKDAQVIVVNHTLLLLDIVSGGKLLPAHDVVVIDEAHHLEEEATRAFTVTVSDRSIHTLLALKEVRAHAKERTLQAVAGQVDIVWSELEYRITNGASRIVLDSAIEDGLKLATLVGELAKELDGSAPMDGTDKDMALYEKVVKRAENLSDHLRTVFAVKDRKNHVYFLDITKRGRRPVIEANAAPLAVASHLRGSLFGHRDLSVICTSATLSAPDLAFFRSRVGLDLTRSTKECILPPVFDYQHNALLYVPRRIPEPAYSGEEAEEYQQAIATEMLKLVQASRGRAFLLFSSKRMLDATYSAIAETIQVSYPVLRQGDLPRVEMVRRFREEQGAVLFGLKSFWEGVDIAGEALSLVVIDKLPFVPPDDPVHEARVNLMKLAGENWFGTYTLPQTILLLKQGVGRLIRTHEDRGVMAILDGRMHSKPYGKRIVDALPPARVTLSIRDVDQFFQERFLDEPSGYCFCGAEVDHYIPDEREPSGLRAVCEEHLAVPVG